MCCKRWTLCHTIQHRAVLIIFPLNHQTDYKWRLYSASSGGERRKKKKNRASLIIAKCLYLQCKHNYRKHRREAGPETDLILAQQINESIECFLIAEYLHQQSSYFQQQLHRADIQSTVSHISIHINNDTGRALYWANLQNNRYWFADLTMYCCCSI